MLVTLLAPTIFGTVSADGFDVASKTIEGDAHIHLVAERGHCSLRVEIVEKDAHEVTYDALCSNGKGGSQGIHDAILSHVAVSISRSDAAAILPAVRLLLALVSNFLHDAPEPAPTQLPPPSATRLAFSHHGRDPPSDSQNDDIPALLGANDIVQYDVRVTLRYVIKPRECTVTATSRLVTLIATTRDPVWGDLKLAERRLVDAEHHQPLPPDLVRALGIGNGCEAPRAGAPGDGDAGARAHLLQGYASEAAQRAMREGGNAPAATADGNAFASPSALPAGAPAPTPGPEASLADAAAHAHVAAPTRGDAPHAVDGDADAAARNDEARAHEGAVGASIRSDDQTVAQADARARVMHPLSVASTHPQPSRHDDSASALIPLESKTGVRPDDTRRVQDGLVRLRVPGAAQVATAGEPAGSVTLREDSGARIASDAGASRGAGAPLALPVLAAGAIAAAVGLAAFSGLRLFTRLTRPAVAQQPVRAQILARLREAPGACAARLADDLRKARTTVTYHLRMLVKEGMVIAREEKGATHYFVAGDARIHTSMQAIEREKPRARLLDAIAQTPGITLQEAAQSAGLAYFNTRYHVRRLEAEGRIVSAREKGVIRLTPSAQPARTASPAPAALPS